MLLYSLRLRLLLMFMCVVLTSMAIFQLFLNRNQSELFHQQSSAQCAAPLSSASSSEGEILPGRHELNMLLVSHEGAFGLAGFVALLLSIFCANMIIRPIKKLTSVAERLEHGDFSQRVKLRSNAENEIGLLGRALNTMAASLERQEQLRRNMVSDIAHELRTPLTNICCYLEVLQGGVIQPTAQVIASLNEEALLLRRLVNDLQELSLAEARQLLLQLQSVALYDLIPSAIEAIRPGALEKRITVLSLLSAGLPDVQVDADRIGQVLRNLLQNAIRHTPVDGNITITALAQNNEVQISVQDTGEGIEEEYLPNIFERFYRADTSRSRATGGSGLGLAIARHLIQAHGGDIKVESRPGYGACFIFTLPTVTSMGSMS